MLWHAILHYMANLVSVMLHPGNFGWLDEVTWCVTQKPITTLSKMATYIKKQQPFFGHPNATFSVVLPLLKRHQKFQYMKINFVLENVMVDKSSKQEMISGKNI